MQYNYTFTFQSFSLLFLSKYLKFLKYETHRCPLSFQDALIKRLGPNAHAFTMSVTHLAPPSVQLVPAKEYNGAPIGTSYDIRAYIGMYVHIEDFLVSREYLIN